MIGRAGAGGVPPVARTAHAHDLPDELARIRLARPRPVLVLVGGAGGMRPEDLRTADTVLRRAVVPAVVALGATVVDGGTDSGVMRAMGRARAATGAAFPLVGVAAEDTVVVPGRTGTRPIDDAATVEGNHTHLVLVPGRTWGAESWWIAQVADVLAAGRPSVTLLVNGGELAYDDVTHGLDRGRPLVVLAGTGRTADAVAAADNPRAAEIARNPLTTVVPRESPDRLREALVAALTSPPP